MWRGVRVWPKEHDWKSCRRHKRLEGSNPSLSTIKFLRLRPVGQGVKTPPFHGGNMGSNPIRVISWRLSSAGRASALQAEGRGFEPLSLHHIITQSSCIANDAGWSSPVARRAHNPKAAGSNPAPATNLFLSSKALNKDIVNLASSFVTKRSEVNHLEICYT